MKIGIISINTHTKVLNFACPLHTYAFQCWLTEHGYDSVVIDYKPIYYNRYDVRHPYDYLKKKALKGEEWEEELIKWQKFYREREKRFDRFEEFINRYYVRTEKTYTQEILDREDPGCDIYMCVTDVIWKYIPKLGFDRGFFLAVNSMKGKGKIAYAASKGASQGASRGALEYNEEQGEIFKSLIRDFDSIAVREKSLQNYINQNTEKEASLVLDPVFLQPKSFYEEMAILPDASNYVLLYTVMEKAHGIIDRAITFAQERGLAVIDVGDDRNILYVSPKGERTIVYDIGIEEWLGYMLKASYIFTNSFHCSAFSIIFNKEFFAGPRKGDKVDNLLVLFDLQQRRMKKDSVLEENKIDYRPINEKIAQYRASSEQFIVDSIAKAEQRVKQSFHKSKKLFFLSWLKKIRR